jgi:hypothetical protein
MVVSRRRRFVGVLSVLVLLVSGGLASGSGVGTAGASSFYWYGESPDCWQTGVSPGSPGKSCDYPGGGVTSNAITGDLNTTASGDYCNVYFAASTVCNNEDSKWPLSFKTTSACAGGSPACGIQHYVSFVNQGDYPWATWAGSPALVISSILTVSKVTTPTSAWAYVCPILQAPGAAKVYLEYCFDRWQGAKSQGNLPEPPFAAQGYGLDATCANVTVGGVGGAVDTLVSPYAVSQPTPYASTLSVSNNTITGGTISDRGFQAEITTADLANAIARDNLPTNGTGSPSPGYGCARGLSTDVTSYRLIGIEDGMEGVAGTQLSATVSSLSARTEYTPVPLAPEATTGAVSGIQSLQATLNGSVNPRGTSTQYYFKYGTTTAYGKTTSEGSAGSGHGSLGESATVALEPGTTYHYRIVAHSEGGAVEGADQTFTTQDEPSSSRWIDFNPDSGETGIYYRNSGGAVAWWQWHPVVGWEKGTLGGTMAAGTTPAVLYSPSSGETSVYYQNGNNEVAFWQWQLGKGWESGTIGGHEALNTSPAVVVNWSTPETTVYYQNSSGEIAFLQWHIGKGWESGVLGGHAAAGSTPAVVYNPANGETAVYYQNSAHELAFWQWRPVKGWESGTIGGHEALNTSPAVVVNWSTPETTVYYQNSSGEIAFLQWHIGKGWEGGVVLSGHAVAAAAGTTPAVVYSPATGETTVYYQDSSSEIAFLQWRPVKGWEGGVLGGKAAAGTSPAVVINWSKPETSLYYQNSSGEIAFWQWQFGAGWGKGVV